MQNRFMFTAFFILFAFILISGCTPAQSPDLKSGKIGIETRAVPPGTYSKILYVSQSGGSDIGGSGSSGTPWATLQKALSQTVTAGPEERIAIQVAEGVYEGETLFMKEFVDLYGGFNPDNWERDIETFQTVLSGSRQRRVIVASDHTVLDGFVITDGRVRGKGAGVFADGVSPVIRNNTFLRNETLGPEPWKPAYMHETANDGGALYCGNGASPVIENNLFVDNTTENGRGAAIAFQTRCNGRIANNLFLRNVSGLQDPMRSSDGGAVSIFDRSNPVIENNVFLNNRSLAKNDAGGLFVALWSSPVIVRNIFAGNQCGDDAGALFVGGQEHRYDAPLDLLPSADNFFVKIYENVFIGNSNPARNSGVMRFTMEGRGEFLRNVAAYNTGIYFQRSEVLIQDNLIMDHFLLVETKEGLKPCMIRNNVFRGNFQVETEAIVEGNITGDGNAKNLKSVPGMKSEAFTLMPDAVLADKSGICTRIFVSGKKFQKDELMERVVRKGEDWGVVKSNTETVIEVWGKLEGCDLITFMPDYR